MKENKVEKYDFAKKPRKGSKFLMWVARTFIVNPTFRKTPLTIKKINMEGLKPPYMLLGTHASEIDFSVMARAILPAKRLNAVCAIDGIRDHGEWLMRSLGIIGKRKFIKDYDLIRNLRFGAEKYGNIVCMYPEARYSFAGCCEYVPPSVGKLCKLLKIPVVILRMYGNFIIGPQWNKPRQKLPLYTEIEQIITAEEIKTLPVDEINERILKGLERDDYRYQLENKIENKYKRRAEGLDNILYRCPHCNAEFKMHSKGTRLWCGECGKAWQMNTLGQLSAEEGETEYSHIPDWFNWERACVREEVRNGTYRFDAEVEVHTLPNAKRFYHHGRGRFVQTAEGTTLTCRAYGEDMEINWAPAELESVHIEFDYPFEKKKYKDCILGDCVDISTNEDSYWLHPLNDRLQLMKISFATEEIYFLAQEKIKDNEK